MSKRNKPGDLMGLANVAPNEKIWLSNPERESKQKKRCQLHTNDNDLVSTHV
jgi:hypothetical protein